MTNVEYKLDAMKKEFLRITKASRCEAKALDYDTVLFEIPLDELKSANDRWWDKEQEFRSKFPFSGDEESFLHIRVEAIVPELVPAKLGDFVMVFDTWTIDPEEFNIGVVTSVREIDGKKCYGVRHIIPWDKLDSSGLSERVVEVTSDDYGGFPVGFYKVIDRKTAIRTAVGRIKAKVKERIRDLSEAANKAEETIGDYLDKLKHRSTAEFLSDDERSPKTYENGY